MTKHIIVIFTLFISLNGYSQDPNFSQFYNIPVYYNPAMNAMGNGLTITSHNRMLWSKIPDHLNTYIIAVEIESIGPFNLGGLFMSNTEGQANLKTNAGYFNFSYTPVDRNGKFNHKLQIGSSIGFLNKTINSNNFVFSDQLDEVYGKVHSSSFENNTNSFFTLDMKFGLADRWSNKFKLKDKIFEHILTYGVSVTNFPFSRENFIYPEFKNVKKWTIHTDYEFKYGSNKVYTASFIFENQKPFQTFTFGINTRLPINQSANNHKLSFGTYYRSRLNSKIKNYDAIILTLGYDRFYEKNKPKFKIYYSYDLTTSQLNNKYSGGSHELSLQVKFDNLIFLKAKASKNFKQRMHKCPSDL